MRKFLKKIAIYLGIVGVLTCLIILFCAPRYWNSRIPILKEKLIGPADTSISLVLGSSHSLYGVNTKLIAENCFNLSSISQSYFEDYHILKKVATQAKIEFVILPLSYFSNFHRLLHSPVQGEALRVYDYERAYGLKYENNRAYYLNQISLLGQISKGIFEPAKQERAIDNRGNLTTSCDKAAHNIGDSIGAFNNHNLQKDFSRRNEYLDSIVSFCGYRQIPLYVVVFPFTSGYLRQIEKNSPEFEPFISEIKKYAINNFQFIDSRYFFKNEEEKFFNDADHLSACGRDSFSTFLAETLRTNSLTQFSPLKE